MGICSSCFQSLTGRSHKKYQKVGTQHVIPSSEAVGDLEDEDMHTLTAAQLNLLKEHQISLNAELDDILRSEEEQLRQEDEDYLDVGADFVRHLSATRLKVDDDDDDELDNDPLFSNSPVDSPRSQAAALDSDAAALGLDD